MRSILDLTDAQPSMVGGDLRDTPVPVPPNVTAIIQPSSGLSLDSVGPVVGQSVKRIPGVTGSPVTAAVNLPSRKAGRR